MNKLKKARAEHKAKASKIQTARTLKEALEQISFLEAQNKAITKLEKSYTSYIIKPQPLIKSEAVAVAMATDWHIGSVIKPETVNYLNEYNVAVARVRVNSFFEKVVKMTNKERQDIQIDELVLFLGGDNFDGNLHEDSALTNEIAEPVKQAVLCQSLIESGLEYLSKNGNFKKINVVCCDGNHGRFSKKVHFSSRQGVSLEHYMHYNLAQRHPEYNWLIADGLFVYMDILGHTVRFLHGDVISFGGVNGPYTYLNRRIYQWDQARHASYTCLGHLHQNIIGGRRWIINGSLAGYSPYAIGFGGEFQPPIQAFFLMDKVRGVTVHIPLLV